jgi:hypothetical protein
VPNARSLPLLAEAGGVVHIVIAGKLPCLNKYKVFILACGSESGLMQVQQATLLTKSNK